MTTQTSARSSGSHSEVERSRLRDQYDLEIDRLAADFHARLPREQAQDIGAIYARYSSRFQDSIADQVRTLFESALAQQIFVPREFVCFDLAVRGAKDRRPGLDRLRSILAEKACQRPPGLLHQPAVPQDLQGLAVRRGRGRRAQASAACSSSPAWTPPTRTAGGCCCRSTP